MSIVMGAIIWRFLSFFVSFFAPFFITYLGFFPYYSVVKDAKLPKFLGSLANFDGVHYVKIAQHGYEEFEQVFFPLYPILIAFFAKIFQNYILSGIIISNLACIGGILMLKKYLESIGTRQNNAIWTLVFLSVFPASYYFSAVYTESVFLLLFTSSLYFCKKEKLQLAIMFAILSALTKFIGVFLLVPFALVTLLHRRKLDVGWILLLISPLVGLGLYSVYLYVTTGDPLFFFHSQNAFAGRSTSLITIPQVYYRYFKIFTTTAHDFQYWIAVLECTTFTFVLSVLIADFLRIIYLKRTVENTHRLALNLFSFVNLILPTLTGTFASIPRYAIFSLSFFIFLGELRSVRLKIILATIFAALYILLFMLFVQGYFVS